MSEELFAKLESEFDPPTMLEFHLGMQLATMIDMWDNTENWQEIEIENMLCISADWVEEFNAKYGHIMEEYHRRARQGLDPTPPELLE